MIVELDLLKFTYLTGLYIWYLMDITTWLQELSFF